MLKPLLKICLTILSGIKDRKNLVPFIFIIVFSYSRLFADEMINVAFNRDFYIEDQKQLIKGLNMYRDSFNVFGFCVPSIVNLDVQLQKLVKLRLTVVRRGVALVQMPVTSIYSNVPWDIRNNQRIESSSTKKGVKNPRYVQLTTVRGMMRFGDLRAEAKEKYLKIKHEKRNKIFAQGVELELEKDPSTIFYKNLFVRLKTKRITKEAFSDICMIGGKKESAARKYINTMLKDEGNKDRIKDLLHTDTIRTIGQKDKSGFIFKA